jgi:uncharacterized protein
MEMYDKKISMVLSNVLKRHPIRFVVLFGSYASGITNEKSDVDIAVFLKDSIPLFSHNAYSDLLVSFAKEFNVSEDRIDLTDLRRANILLRYEIMTGGLLLFGDYEECEEYSIFAFKDYVDARPLFDAEDAIIRARQKILGRLIGV